MRARLSIPYLVLSLALLPAWAAAAAPPQPGEAVERPFSAGGGG
jgi:hypothetical protein